MTSKILIDRDALLAAANRLSDRGQAQVAAPLWEALAAPEAPCQSEPVAWGAWRKSLNRFHYIECNVDYMQRTYGKASEDMGIDFELVPLYRHPAPLSPDHSGGGAGMVAAEAFAKGFNTLETSGGKYKIVMQFAGHDDAWAAYTALGKLTACLDKVKELNQ